jgi:hypothetical protein
MNHLALSAGMNDFYNRMFDNYNPILNGGDDGTANAIFSPDSFMNRYNITNQSQVKYIDFVARGIRVLTNHPNVKVIITEIGTPSTNDVFNYWGSESSPVLNFSAQANGWDGVIPALKTENNVIEGINVWSVNPWHTPSDTTNQTWKTDWDFVGKPAYPVIQKWFTASAGTNVQKDIQDTLFIFYPNPFREVCILKVPGGMSLNNIVVQIYNLPGKVVLTIPVTKRETNIDRGLLPAGMYIYRIFNTTAVLQSGKLMLE